MKNEIIARIADRKVELDEESFCWFRVDDIITRDSVYPGNQVWCRETVKIVGFTHNPDRLWGVIMRIGETYERIPLWTDDLNGLLLLERKGWEFKVGDEVINTMLEEGEIVMINPDTSGRIIQKRYLVEFKRNQQNKAVLESAMFIPFRYRNLVLNNCSLCSEEGDLAKRY